MARPITVSIVGNAGPLKKSIKEADVALDKFGQGLKKFGLAAAAGIGAVGAGIAFAAKAAAEDQKSFELMSVAIKNVTGATNAHIKEVDRQIGKMSLATGIADDKLRPAFAALTRGTRDIEQATKDFGIVLDVSTALGLDQVQVAEALAKGYSGNMKALAALSPELKTMIREGADMNEVLERLSSNFEGASAAAADTFQGRLARLNVAFSEIVEQIGYAVLPILTRIAEFIADRIVPVVQEFADAFSEDGLGGVLSLTTEKMLRFYDEAGFMTKAIITATIAVGALFAAFKALTFIQTVTTLVNGLTASINVATVSMGAFQTTALGMLKVVGVVIASLAISIDSLLADNAFAAKGLMESVAKFANLIIASLEALFNSAVIGVNLLNRAFNAISPIDVDLIPLVKFGRISEDFGSSRAFDTPGTPGAPIVGIPDRLDRLSAVPGTSPAVIAPMPMIPELNLGGGGGGGGSRTGGGTGGGGGGEGGQYFTTPGFFGPLDPQEIADFLARSDQRTLPDTVNITVNTVSADANLPTLIVEALQTYNLQSGPIDVAIAV